MFGTAMLRTAAVRRGLARASIHRHGAQRLITTQHKPAQRRQLATLMLAEAQDNTKLNDTDPWTKPDPFGHTASTRTTHTCSKSAAEDIVQSDDGALEHSIRDFLGSTRQRPRAGLKADELVVKCPVCSPGKPRRLAYSAHLSTQTGAFVCTNCFEQGSWDKYQELAMRRNFQNTIPRTRATDPPPFEFAETTLVQLRTNLVAHEEIYAALTGHEKGQLRLRPEILAQYGVGLGFLDTGVPEISDVQALVEGSDHAVPCLVFPRTAFRTNSFIEGTSSLADIANSTAQQNKGVISSMLSEMQADSNSVSDSAQAEFRTVQLKVVGWNTAELEMYVPVDEAQPGLFGFHIAGPDSSDVILTSHELDAVAA
ncbi:hypothetical protein GGH18_004958, partial [Coemansia sp. RSA 530]